MSNNNLVITVTEIDYHRNGVSGEGFYVVTFISHPAWDGDTEKNMIGIVFEGVGQTAVLDADLVGEGVIEFGKNSWRGDHYEPLLRKAIDGFSTRGEVPDDTRDGGFRYDMEAILATYPPKPMTFTYGPGYEDVEVKAA